MARFLFFLLLVLSFTPSSSSSHPAKSDITGIFLRMCDTLLCGEHGPGKLKRMGACVCMNVRPLEVSLSGFTAMTDPFIMYLLRTSQQCLKPVSSNSKMCAIFLLEC